MLHCPNCHLEQIFPSYFDILAMLVSSLLNCEEIFAKLKLNRRSQEGCFSITLMVMLCFSENLVAPESVLQNIFNIGLVELLLLFLSGHCEFGNFPVSELCKLQTSSFERRVKCKNSY